MCYCSDSAKCNSDMFDRHRSAKQCVIGERRLKIMEQFFLNSDMLISTPLANLVIAFQLSLASQKNLKVHLH